MKKANNKKLAAIMALVSALSTKPANALSNPAKVGIMFAIISGIVGGGFLINYLVNNKKEKGDDESNKKTNPAKVNQKGQYYDKNIKIITTTSGMDKEPLDKFIGFIKSQDNSFLEQIMCYDSGNEHYRRINSEKAVWDDGEWRSDETLQHFNIGYCSELSDDVIKQKKISEGVPWVNKFFNDLRGNAEIGQIKSKNHYSCDITVDGVRYEVEIYCQGGFQSFSWIRISRYDQDGHVSGLVEYLTK